MTARALLALVLLAPPSPPAASPARVVEGAIESQALGARAPYAVLLPPGYDAGLRRYPVLYLLHGYGGRFDDWIARTNLAARLSGEDLIVVLPEGANLWYVNSPKGREQDHLLKELVPEIDRVYRTLPRRSARFVGGLSMGGYGALLLAFRHPETFSFAASFSGALDAATSTSPSLLEMTEPVFGPPGSALRAANDLFSTLESARPPHPYVYFDCGTEDGFLEANRAFARALHEAGVAYEYRERPGAHGWDYWDRQVGEMLRVLEAFQRAPR